MMPSPNEDAESFAEARERRQRERYALVRGYSYKLYVDICAFSSTVPLDGDVRTRAQIEDFCMGLVKQIVDQEGL